MATRYLEAAAKGVSRSALDVPMAAFAAMALAFVAYAVPEDILTGLVQSSGLASILPAAEPPLGTTARLMLGAVCAALGFAIVYALMRLIDRASKPSRPRRKPARPAEDVEPDLAEAEAPRLRRWDVHPDAPSRRPIFAASDVGEPEAAFSPAPFYQPDDFPSARETSLDPEVEDPVEQEEAELLIATEEAELLVARGAPDASGKAAIPAPAATDTIPDLMARLEAGLSRRLARQGVFPKPEAVSAAAHEDAGDDRLRSAIDSLQKMASRGA